MRGARAVGAVTAVRAGVAAVVAVVVVAIVAATVVSGHEIGTTQVTATLVAPDRYAIVVVTDAAALLDKLAPEGPVSDGTAAGIAGALEARSEIFLSRIAVRFDGTAVRPEVRWQVEAGRSVGAPPRAEIHLTGARPAGSREFTWTYGWTFASYALVTHTVEHAEPVAGWLEGGEVSPPVRLAGPQPAVSAPQLAGRYIVLGFTHILPLGLDHVLFVLGLFLASRRWRPLLAQVSAFTIAHSLTLGLSIYGLVAVPAGIVEPLIALSIAYVAIENTWTAEMRSSRVALVFACGLLHGLGFAGVLQEVGLPGASFVTALLGFNVGVELGQLTVIGLAFVLVGHRWGGRAWYRQRIVLPASACIALAGVYWTIERVRPLL